MGNGVGEERKTERVKGRGKECGRERVRERWKGCGRERGGRRGKRWRMETERSESRNNKVGKNVVEER